MIIVQAKFAGAALIVMALRDQPGKLQTQAGSGGAIRRVCCHAGQNMLRIKGRLTLALL
ncbi:MAG: hypothetical protein Q8J70_12820 [Thiobacillus sp.]|nr:hypothetical protein [Thiobacillus sp.]